MARKPSPVKMFGYVTYNFRDKDPIIDILRTIVKDNHLDYNDIALDSGVHPTTLMAWIYGLTRSPRYVTIAAVFRAVGYDLVPEKARVVAIRRKA